MEGLNSLFYEIFLYSSEAFTDPLEQPPTPEALGLYTPERNNPFKKEGCSTPKASSIISDRSIPLSSYSFESPQCKRDATRDAAFHLLKVLCCECEENLLKGLILFGKLQIRERKRV
jgi:hypothetical protein